MTSISKSKPVMVTGATGYVAGWLVKQLLENGIPVHAAVRNPENKAKVEHLDSLAKQFNTEITYFKSDLLKEGSYAEAMQGCELVFHTASPFTNSVKNPQKELVDPAKLGTKNVLDQASKTPTVKRVVLTSSCAAIYGDALDLKKTPNGEFTEQVWNTTSSLDYQPYSYSKTVAEREAWEIANNQSQWDLVVINPSFVMGPPLNPKTNTSESMNILKQLGDGTMKAGVPKLGVGVVDVRDVANAHYLAGYTPTANGRNITSGHNTDFLQMGLALRPKFGDSYPLPKRALPKWLLMLVGPMADKLFTRRFIKANVNEPWIANNSKITNELGMTFRPLQQTMEDGFQVLIDNGAFKK